MRCLFVFVDRGFTSAPAAPAAPAAKHKTSWTAAEWPAEAPAGAANLPDVDKMSVKELKQVQRETPPFSNYIFK